MRLGQLARKIGVQPSRISTFLENKKYKLDAGSNTKLTDEQEELVKTEFDYVEEETAPAVDEIAVAEAEEISIETEVAAEVSIEEPESQLNEEVIEVVEETVEEENEEVAEIKEESPAQEIAAEQNIEVKEDDMEVIRAPKLKLDGLKVVGKIDLPEPKVKEEVAPATDEANPEGSEDTPEVEVKPKPVRKKANYKKPNNRKPEKRVWTLEEKQARDERVKKRKAKEKKEKEKELKAAHYESKMRQKELEVPVKKAKKKAAKKTTQHYQAKSNKPAPTTVWGKFMHWLNS